MKAKSCLIFILLILLILSSSFAEEKEKRPEPWIKPLRELVQNDFPQLSAFDSPVFYYPKMYYPSYNYEIALGKDCYYIDQRVFDRKTDKWKGNLNLQASEFASDCRANSKLGLVAIKKDNSLFLANEAEESIHEIGEFPQVLKVDLQKEAYSVSEWKILYVGDSTIIAQATIEKKSSLLHVLVSIKHRISSKVLKLVILNTSDNPYYSAAGPDTPVFGTIENYQRTLERCGNNEQEASYCFRTLLIDLTYDKPIQKEMKYNGIAWLNEKMNRILFVRAEPMENTNEIGIYALLIDTEKGIEIADETLAFRKEICAINNTSGYFILRELSQIRAQAIGNSSFYVWSSKWSNPFLCYIHPREEEYIVDVIVEKECAVMSVLSVHKVMVCKEAQLIVYDPFPENDQRVDLSETEIIPLGGRDVAICTFVLPRDLLFVLIPEGKLNVYSTKTLLCVGQLPELLPTATGMQFVWKRNSVILTRYESNGYLEYIELAFTIDETGKIEFDDTPEWEHMPVEIEDDLRPIRMLTDGIPLKYLEIFELGKTPVTILGCSKGEMYCVEATEDGNNLFTYDGKKRNLVLNTEMGIYGTSGVNNELVFLYDKFGNDYVWKDGEKNQIYQTRGIISGIFDGRTVWKAGECLDDRKRKILFNPDLKGSFLQGVIPDSLSMKGIGGTMFNYLSFPYFGIYRLVEKDVQPGDEYDKWLKSWEHLLN